VGKSTLFNRLARRRLSIVDDEPGVTRDRVYALARPQGARFHLIDTGGMAQEGSDAFLPAIRQQVTVAVDEADVIIHLSDGREGLHPDDIHVADLLRRSGKPIITAVNKVDAKEGADGVTEFYRLGVETVLPVSSAHGLGMGDLVDAVLEAVSPELKAAAEAASAFLDTGGRPAAFSVQDEEDLPAPPPDQEDRPEEVRLPAELRVAVVGRPNAGKSCLVNAILGEPRMVVSEIAGTTRDAVDSLLEVDGKRFRLVDTAGIRRKRSVAQKLEKLSVFAAIRAIEDAHVAILVLDGYQGVAEQDAKIAQLIVENGKALVIVVNKWDLAEPGVREAPEAYATRVHREMGFVSFAPVLFVSALNQDNTHQVLASVAEVAHHHFRRLATSVLNRLFERAKASHHLPAYKGRLVSLSYCTQVAVAPPTIVVATNVPEGVHFSYRRYLLNTLRQQFGFVGTPVRLIFRRKGRDIGRNDSRPNRRKKPRRG
jgi:GTP-binding protein